MREPEYKSRDKKTHKMTRDGLIEENQTQGTTERISSRQQDVSFSRQEQQPKPEAIGRRAQKATEKQHLTSSDHRQPHSSQKSEVPVIQDIQNTDTRQNEPEVIQQEELSPNPIPNSASSPAKKRTDRTFHFQRSQGGQYKAPEIPDKPADPPQEGRYKQSDTSQNSKVRQDTQAEALDPKSKGKKQQLQFTEGETISSDPSTEPGELPPDKRLDRLGKKANKANTKLEKAQEKLPKKKKLKSQRFFDEETGKTRRKLYFEDEVKKAPQPDGLLKRGAKSLAYAPIRKAHQKIHEVEKDNAGVEAAHKTEEKVEQLIQRHAKASKRHKMKPYRKTAKMEKRAARANVKHLYQKTLLENPSLKSSNPVNKFIQKQAIKRRYAEAYRATKNGAQAAKQTATTVVKIGTFFKNLIVKNKTVILWIAVILLVVIFCLSLFGSCSAMLGEGFGTYIGSSYLADDESVTKSDELFSELETDLQIEIQNVESNNPGYDEYRYSVADISHNPFELLAFLTAVYEDFTFSEVQGIIRELFNEMYTLTLEEEIEIRTRTVTHTDSEGNSYEEEEEYEWYILNVTLTTRPFSDVAYSRMTSEQAGQYQVYLESRGSRQYFDSPFDFDWIPYVTSAYGYRIHPITGEKDFHQGVDIGVPAGTTIQSTQRGTVITATFNNSYGNYIVIENTEYGWTSLYAHCDTLLVSVGQTVDYGDPIATVGSTGDSTGNHLHLEIQSNGVYLNPYFFVESGLGYINGSVDGSPVGGAYPGEPIDSDAYAALIAEAEKHLGKAYVFGANGPANFDCSSFVCWVFRESGVYNISRTTAQGIYNQCTPISASEAKPGDIIFFTGTYSTTNPVSHVGIYVGNGMMIHCGDPVKYTSINTSYWQSHFYAFGRLSG